MSGKVLIAGIGNIFLGDDAFGVEVVQRLASMAMPDYVHVRDFGIRSYDLAYALMEPWELVILVDAVPRGEDPGTVYTIEPEIPDGSYAAEEFNPHSMNPISVLQLVSALGGDKVGRMLLVGCEPANLEPDKSGRIGLSSAVQPAVEEALNVIQEIIRKNGNVSAA
jgi:hydrogenase maturation protease